MTEIRCVKCNRLLMKGTQVYAEVKCPKCGYLNHVDTCDFSLSRLIGHKGTTFTFNKDGTKEILSQ